VRELGPDSLVVEAASNDGYLLQYFEEAGVRTLGVELAENVVAVARERGIEAIADFLDEKLARWIVAEHGRADLVVANTCSRTCETCAASSVRWAPSQAMVDAS
jgi:hypothetical protein